MRWKTKALFLALSFLIVLLVTCLTVALHRTKGPIAIICNSYTNGIATFTLTNLNSFPIEFMVHIERKTGNSWPDYTGHGLPHEPPNGHFELSSRYLPVVRPKQSLFFSVNVKPEVPHSPWRLTVFYNREWDRLDDITEEASQYLEDHNMPSAADWLWAGSGWSLASGPETQQEQNASNKSLQPTAVDPDTFTLK
jgi:hypothetical protein